MQKKKICCFGEMLWDVVSDGKHPGGAPLNVAYHLAKFGADVCLISKVGDDADGRELQRLATSWNINTELLQVDSRYETGTVNAAMLENGEVEYDIKSPVAWDYIELSSGLKDAVKVADCFIFGSLSARNEQSEQTLMELLEVAKFRVFDINLRFPHYNSDTLGRLLEQADLVKLNNWELLEVNNLLDLNPSAIDEDALVHTLKKKFGIGEVVVTKGKDGASFYGREEVVHQTSETLVQVKDTIGCGDAFLSAMMMSYLRDETPEIMLRKAVAMGAFIASKSGACPTYNLSEYDDFYAEHYKVKGS